MRKQYLALGLVVCGAISISSVMMAPLQAMSAKAHSRCQASNLYQQVIRGKGGHYNFTTALESVSIYGDNNVVTGSFGHTNVYGNGNFVTNNLDQWSVCYKTVIQGQNNRFAVHSLCGDLLIDKAATGNHVSIEVLVDLLLKGDNNGVILMTAVDGRITGNHNVIHYVRLVGEDDKDVSQRFNDTGKGNRIDGESR